MTNPDTTEPGSPHQHALKLAAQGLRVLPIKPGRKHPPMNSWQHAATDDPAKIDNWFNGLYRDCGVGLALGPQPCGLYLFAVDIDTHDPTADGWEALHDLEHQHGPLPDTWRSLTGAGGGHLIYGAPPGVTVRNQQAAGNRIAAGIDVRGDGGQIVVAPTTHPDTGRQYAWEHDYAPWERNIAQAPDWLLELVADPPTAITPIAPPNIRDAGGTVFDLHRQDWNWETELLNRGWTQCGTRGQDSYWARPGKNRRDGHSAVLHHPDGPFVIFTTEIPQQWTAAGTRTTDGSGWAFGPFGFYAATEHAGDRSTASKTLSDRYGLTWNGNLDGLVTTNQLADADDDTREDDWTRRPLADLARAILAGDYQPETPTGLHVEDGMPLLYRGRVHSIFGPPGGGKTWVALCALVEALKAGEHVLMIDWEDAQQGTTQRLLQLGCTPDELERFDYRNPTTSLLFGWPTLETDPTPWTLIVIDSAGEALAAQGVELNDDTGTARWMQLAKKLARRPQLPIVLMLDHIPKSGDEPAKYAIGSQRKLAAITGASYRCDTIIEPAKGKDGKLKLVTAKDRLGNRAKNHTACEVNLHDEDDQLLVRFVLPESQAAAMRGERFRPTTLMERISRWLEYNPGASRREIEKAVEGKANGLRTAIDVLLEEGFVTVEQVGQKHRHTVIRDYRESMDGLTPPVDNPGAPPASHRVPTASLTSWDAAETGRVPRVPASLLTQDAGRGQDPENTPSVDKPRPPDVSAFFGPEEET